MSFNWLITGASNGLGATLAIHALRAGHGVVATARNVPKASKDFPEIEERGGKWLKLDVTQPDTEEVVRKVVQEQGINVIVNNAGFGGRGVLEDFTLPEVQKQFDTNVFGAVAVMKGAIPTWRERQDGTFVNISSVAGMVGNPGSSLYSASKFALEGFTEAIALELSPFNIRCLIVQPGGFRTDFQRNVLRPIKGRLSQPYEGTLVHKQMDRIEEGPTGHGRQPGDPDKAADAIIEVVTKKGKGGAYEGVLRLALGNDAVDRARAKLKSWSSDVDRTEALGRGAVYDG
ncbi:putative short chain oxidoreductase/dehydrogenase [Rhizodiscina lignyota]|uniref:Short chain oxidoreductase/dehydrogenase n=1 Tax=Rhizodiscina lignyota TaxID=1504668 RepID=A0A9P4IAW6_9PEZI|nr:putative short chain oxidoreductase/dehydrogenase [Rhizodiscina lignyota]